MALELVRYLYQYSDLSPIPINAEITNMSSAKRKTLSLSVPDDCKGAIVIITVFWRMHS
jgi:hypothetical protein